MNEVVTIKAPRTAVSVSGNIVIPAAGLGPSRSAQNRSSASSRHRFTASQHPPHCRGRHNRSSASFSRTTAASGSTPSQRSSGDGYRLAPSQFLRIVDLAQVQQRPLHHTASAYPAILHDAPVTVLFAVLLAL